MLNMCLELAIVRLKWLTHLNFQKRKVQQILMYNSRPLFLYFFFQQLTVVLTNSTSRSNDWYSVRLNESNEIMKNSLDGVLGSDTELSSLGHDPIKIFCVNVMLTYFLSILIGCYDFFNQSESSDPAIFIGSVSGLSSWPRAQHCVPMLRVECSTTRHSTGPLLQWVR